MLASGLPITRTPVIIGMADKMCDISSLPTLLGTYHSGSDSGSFVVASMLQICDFVRSGLPGPSPGVSGCKRRACHQPSLVSTPPRLT